MKHVEHMEHMEQAEQDGVGNAGGCDAAGDGGTVADSDGSGVKRKRGGGDGGRMWEGQEGGDGGGVAPKMNRRQRRLLLFGAHKDGSCMDGQVGKEVRGD